MAQPFTTFPELEGVPVSDIERDLLSPALCMTKNAATSPFQPR